MDKLFTRLEDAATRAARRFALLLGPRFPVVLAIVLSLAAATDAFVKPFMTGLEKKSYDLMLRNRILAPAPDPDIVILDIDEASLEAMAAEHGRWPWPRAVLAEALDAIEAQGPKAILFDILFADLDVRDPGSDALFDEAVARSARSWFAMLRLDASRDSKSELRASQVPGAARTPDSGEGRNDPTLAMILPRYPAIIASGRVGTVGADPDSDGVIRRFGVYRDEGDWRIASLPWRIAAALGAAEPPQPGILLNWRGGPYSYRYVSFAEFHADALRRDKRRDPKEFAGRIVLVGSTAPGLFDLKATPITRAHPGVEILATAIDNLRRDDYLHVLDKRLSFGVSIVLIWGLAFFTRSLARGVLLGPVMFGVQLLLLMIAYASVNLSDFYLDLVAPVAFGMAFFVAANLRADLREWAAQASDPAALGLERGRRYRLLLLVMQPVRVRLRGRTRTRLIDRVCGSRANARLADPPYGGEGVLGLGFAGLATVFWVVPADEAAVAAASAERASIEGQVRALERAGVRLAEQEGEFEWSGERVGVVGELVIDALKALRRPE